MNFVNVVRLWVSISSKFPVPEYVQFFFFRSILVKRYQTINTSAYRGMEDFLSQSPEYDMSEPRPDSLLIWAQIWLGPAPRMISPVYSL